MNLVMNHVAVFCIIVSVGITEASESVARVTRVEGKASLMRTAWEEWRELRPNTPLRVGDQVYTREESFVELRYTGGEILRMNENSKITIRHADGMATKNYNGVGQIWVNMKKVASKGNEFEVSSPTAVAAIRGTVFKMDTREDSSTDVSVYDGKVEVGPSDELKKKQEEEKQKKQSPPPGGVTEVPGPEEVPGPYEVPLETWRMIVSGQMISVRSDGTFAQEQFDVAASAEDAFVKKNMELDAQIEEQ